MTKRKTQSWFNTPKWINRSHQFNSTRDKNHVTISKDAEWAFGKIQYPFMIRALRMLGIEGESLDTIKSICGKPTANITLHSEQLNAALGKFYLATSGQHFPGSSNQCK